MSEESKQKFSWYPEDGNCQGIYDSIDEALLEAVDMYENGDGPFDDEDTPSLIHVGPAGYFPFESICDDIVDFIMGRINDVGEEYVNGISDHDIFSYHLAPLFKERLLNLLQDGVSIRPYFVCRAVKSYDLSLKKFV